MFIEFSINVDANHSFIGSHLFRMLKSEIANWANTNEIKYTSKLYKHTFRVAFDDDRHYTIFRLTWQDLPYIEYKLIDRKW